MRGLLLCAIWLFFSVNAQANLDKSVVRIGSTLLLYDYKYPWKVPKRKNIVGSGVIIQNQYILTAAHVVSNAKTIAITKSDSSKKYYAKVKYISFQADLALLEVYDKQFFNQTKPLNLTTKNKIGDKITVAGYPLSRKTLHSKQGKLTDIKYTNYSLSNESLLSLKLDIDLKAGNSGGPVLNHKGKIIGIAIQIPKDSSKTAYAVPSYIINTFLADIKDGKTDGFHSNSNVYQRLENEAMQSYYNFNEEAMIINSIDVNEKQLQVNDIILSINNKRVASLNENMFLLEFHIQPVLQTIPMVLLRKGQKITLAYKLGISSKLLKQEFEIKPRYFVLGGLVFAPLTRNYLRSLGMKQYEMDMLFYGQHRSQDLEEKVVWLEDKFLHKVNQGYDSNVEIVEFLDGVKIRSFEHFVQLIKASKKEFIAVQFLNKERIILSRKEALSFKGVAY